MTRQKNFAASLLSGEVSNVAWFWSDVEYGRADRDDVVDLARVNDADELFTHHDDVQIGCRKRAGKRVEWLIRQNLDVLEFMA